MSPKSLCVFTNKPKNVHAISFMWLALFAGSNKACFRNTVFYTMKQQTFRFSNMVEHCKMNIVQCTWHLLTNKSGKNHMKSAFIQKSFPLKSPSNFDIHPTFWQRHFIRWNSFDTIVRKCQIVNFMRII